MNEPIDGEMEGMSIVFKIDGKMYSPIYDGLTKDMIIAALTLNKGYIELKEIDVNKVITNTNYS